MATIYGYARISTKQQNIERQIRNIKGEYPEAVIVEETYSGTSEARPKLNKLVKTLKKGDTVVFDSVSRMSRNANAGYKLYEELYNKGVTLVFIKEPHINTTVFKRATAQRIELTGGAVDVILEAVTTYMMIVAKEQIKLAFIQSEKEVLDLRQRTKEGLKTAKLNGKQVGGIKGKSLTTKKSIEAKAIIKRHNKAFGGSLNDVETIKQAGINRNTFYKYKRELLEEQGA